MKRRRRLFAACALAGLVVAAVASGQLASDEAVVDFRIPGFNENGYKIWEIGGRQARPLDKGGNRLEITALDVKVFLGDEAGTLDTEITSPLAIVEREEHRVSGPGQLRAVGRDRSFEIFGDEWTYDLDKKTVVIRRHVVVTLAGNIGDILK